MRNILMTTVTALFVAGTATAAELGGSVGVEVSKNNAGDYVATTTLGFGASTETGVGLAFGGFTFESVDSGDLTVDEWQVGVALPSVTLSFGNQGDIFVSNNFEIVGGDTIANPVSDHESLIVEFGAAAVLVGFTDITTDLGDIENVQGSYTFAVAGADLTAVGDYNINSENWTLGAKADATVGEFAVGGIVTYANDTEVFGYEASAGYNIVTAFVNGDNTNMLQNVGAVVAYDFSGLNLYAEGTYNVDDKTNRIGAGVSLNF